MKKLTILITLIVLSSCLENKSTTNSSPSNTDTSNSDVSNNETLQTKILLDESFTLIKGGLDQAAANQVSSLSTASDQFYSLDLSNSFSLSGIQFLDVNGKIKEDKVTDFYKINNEYYLIKVGNKQVYLVEKNTNDVHRITKYINSDFICGVIRNGYLFTANKNEGKIYKTSLNNFVTTAINDSDSYIDIQQSSSRKDPGFFVSESGSVITIVKNPNLGYAIYFENDTIPKRMIQNAPFSVSINDTTAPWPRGNATEIYGENGKLYEIVDNYVCVDPQGVGGAPLTCDGDYKIREYSYGNQITSNNGVLSYAQKTQSTIASVSSVPLLPGIVPTNNIYTREDRNRYLFSYNGYFKVTAIPAGGLNVVYQSKDLSEIYGVPKKHRYISEDYLYWLTEAGQLKRIKLAPVSSPEIIVNASVTSYQINENYLTYQTSTQTKIIDLENISRTLLVGNGSINIESVLKF